jgi:ATP-dependent RNA helicase RhlE
MSFKQFELHPKCLRAIEAQGITEPTPIQQESIPVALEGRDVIAVAQTGTGKTLAFSLPSLTYLADGPRKRTQMLVLTPTRELAQQVEKVIAPIARAMGLRSVCVFGGVGMLPQTRALRSGTEIVIATPGRLLDHISRGNVRFDDLSILVLDEADRMLDMGFMPDMRRIIDRLPEERQTLLFSATFPKEIRRLAADFQHEPEYIEVGGGSKPIETVRQGLYTVDAGQKTKLLSTILNGSDVKSTIVFLRTKHRTDKVARLLNNNGFTAQAIHGGRSQSQRDKALEKFRKGHSNVLVATDVAARGIDIRGVTHVVNYDIPRSFDDYVHRIGRTGRANEEGDAITFVSPEEHKDLSTIERGLGKSIPRTEWEGSVSVRSGFGSNDTGNRNSSKKKNSRPRRRYARAAR